MTDKFEEFESNVYNWISRHKLGLMIVGFFVILWVVLSLAVVGLWGIVGAANMESNMRHAYNGEEISYNLSVTNETYDTFQNIIIPVSIPMFDTINWLMLILGIGYVALLAYLFLKWFIRTNKNV